MRRVNSFERKQSAKTRVLSKESDNSVTSAKTSESVSTLRSEDFAGSFKKMEPPKVKNRPIEEDSGDLSPILVGDYIVLQDLTLESPGFVSGDAAFQRCGVQKLPSNHRSPSQYDDYVFQIFPALIYRSRMEQLTKTKSRAVTRSRASSSLLRQRTNSVTSMELTERDNEEKLLHERIEHEDRLNQATMHEVRRGIRKEALRYGQTIQLLHVKSNLFITCHHSAALKDASCRKVSLREGALSAQFQVLPCFKAQTEGSVIFSTHSIKLASVRLNGNMFLHTSEKVYEDVFREESTTLSSCLRIQHTMELNASSKFTTFVIRKCSSFKKGTHDCLQSSFSPFRFYHSQAESFIVASSNKDKNYLNKTRKAKFKGVDSDNLLTLPPHIAYLREVDQHNAGEEPDPTDPRNHTSKSVWVLEPVKLYPLNRNSSGAVGWGEPVRIRHLPSGRYLCVDTSGPFHNLPPSERWYRTYLVIEPTDDPVLLQDSANYCAPGAAVFRLECEGTAGEYIPKNVSSCRVEFKLESRGSSINLFLHNADVPKPKVGDPTYTSRMIVFSTTRSAQDALKIMPVSYEESQLIFRVKSFIPIVMAYAERVADAKLWGIPSVEKLNDTMHVMLKIISFQSKSDSKELEGIDWIKKANSMLPSAFSALFEGETSEISQRICRDLKLLDAVFAVSLAPYQRFPNPFNAKEKESMMGCAGIQKLVHVALQRMFVKNNTSQLYFRRTSPPVRPLLRGNEESQSSWMELLKLQLEDPLGSAVSLSKLLSSNGVLLRTYATPSMVHEFARMIRELGPQPRLVNFFESICAIDDLPVKANQEMILRICWRLPEDRTKLFVEMVSMRMDKPDEYGELSRLPGGDYIAKNTAAVKQDTPPVAYYGKENFTDYPVFVHWAGHEKWSQGMPDYLFFGPSAMTGKGGLKVRRMKDKALVRIEEFCWVVEPERLCEAVTGIKWSTFDMMRDTDTDVASRFSRQEQLVQYFIAEMDMLAKLCFGRSYNAITLLQTNFPYCMLISVIKNTHLPCLVRASMLNLLRVIYVDRFPQMMNCARPSIPEVLWVYDASDMPKEDIVSTPVIQPINLKNGKNAKFAFPSFQISRTHKFYEDPDPLMSFPDDNKFFLLASALNDIMKSFGSGRIDHSNRSMNTLATATVKTLSDLLSFGFLSSYDKMKVLVKSLARLLDGRRDVKYVMFDELGYEPYEEGFFPPQQRFELSTNSVSVTSVKKVALDVMLAVSDFRCQFRLGKLLHIFKEYTEDKKHLKELKVFHGYMAKFEERSYDGFLTTQLFQQFEDLFTAGDGKLLDFEEMSRQPLMTILLDALMYKDDILHSKALQLLDCTYAQRAQLIKALKDVILLPRAPHYPQLNSDINYFVLLLRSTEVWAVSSKISGPFDEKKESDFHELCETIDMYLYVKIAAKYAHRKSMIDSLIGAGAGVGKNIQLSFGQAPSKRKTGPGQSPVASKGGTHDNDEDMMKKKAPVTQHQDMLRAMNLQFALTRGLTIDYNLAFKGSICSPEDKIKSRDIHIKLLRKVVMLITDFVKHNIKNQDIIYESALPFLREHLGDLKLPPLAADFPTDSKTRKLLVTQPGLNTEEVIIECLRGNGRLCEEIPVSLLDEFGSLLNKQIDMSCSPLLELFHIAIRPDPTLNPLFRNQEATLDQLISSKYPNTSACVFGCFNLHGQPTPEKPELIVNLLSNCIEGDNGMTAARLQGLGITVDATFEVLVEKLSNSVNAGQKELDLDDAQPSSPKETKSDRWTREAQLMKDDYFISLVKFLDLQLTSLVVDPRMYQRPEMWRVVSVGVGTLISAFATNLHKCMGGAPAASLVKLCDVILPAIRIVHQFYKGATSMGMDDLLGRFGDRLRGEPKEFPNSVLGSLLRIRSYLDHNDKGKKRNFPKELITLEHHITISSRNLQFLLNPDSELEAEGSIMVEAQNDMDNDSIEMPAVKRSPSLDRMAPSKVVDSDSPEVLLSYFVEAIMGNTKINQKLLSRKFDFLNVLESVELRTMSKSDMQYETAAAPEHTGKFGGFGGMIEHALDSALDHKGHTEGGQGEAEYGVRITWAMVVDRLVAFARAHNFDSDESPLIRVHNVLRNHVLKARSVEATSHVFDSSEMNFDDVEAFREVQNKLDKSEVTEMALLAISTHTPGARDTAAVSAIELLRELLFSGNKNVQSSVLYYIEHVDKDARFLKHMRARLQESAHYIKERCDQVRQSYAPMQREHQLEYEEAEQTLKLLTEMLEGHNYAVQNIIRSQPQQAADVDLIKMVFDLLHLQVGQPHLLKRMGEPSINLLTSTLVFIVECLQGPCDGNQEAFAKSESTIAAVKTILQSSFHPRIARHEVMKVKCRAILIFAACLEGRKDRKVHDILVAHIDPFLLQQFAMEVTDFIRDTASGSATWSKDIHLKKKVINEALQGLVALANTRTELNLVGSFAAETAEMDARKGKIAVEKMLRQAVASVEVMWNGRIEFVSFPLPKATAFLSSTAKAQFLETVDLSSHEKRMKELIRAEPNLSAEMHTVYTLAKQSALYRYMHKHFSTFKMIQYALVVLLNLNVIMTQYGNDKESGEGEKEDLGYNSAFYAAFYGGMDKKYRLSLLFTYVLGVPNILGCFLMMGYMGVSNVPIVIRMIDSNSYEKKLEAASGQDVSYRNKRAFKTWGVALVFNFIFIVLHMAAYPDSPQISLYAVLLLGISLPWTFICLRNYVVVANSANTRMFCIIYDSLVTKPFFRNQILLVFFSINGFRHSPYFSFMLLDVVNISPTIQSLVKSVTKPAPQLGIVAYLFVIIVVIFSSFGLEYFEPYFVYDEMYDDDSDDITGVNPYGCHSVVACAWLIFYKGLPEGRMDQVLDVITNRDDQYIARVLFDLSFFIIVGVFLFNIITGLIVDTFGSLREEAAARADQLDNECYVCGFTRTAYDDIGMVSPSFDSHKMRNHYIWNYLYFIQYILAKDQTDFSGVESYVHGMLQSKCQDWLPARTSFATQNHGIFSDKEDASKEREKRISDKMENSFEAVDKRFKEITGKVDKMGERFGSELEAFQTHMEQFVVKVLKGSKI